MKIAVKALKRIGRYRPGDVLELTQKDAAAFVRLGIVEEVHSEPYVPLMTTSINVEDDEPAPTPARRRREYKRRDMRAEG